MLDNLFGASLLCVVGIVFVSFFFIWLVYKMFFKAAGNAQAKVMRGYQENAAFTDALGTLNRRLAAGEIDDAEYQRLRDSMERNARK
jgi:uncharacterized membrane protein